MINMATNDTQTKSAVFTEVNEKTGTLLTEQQLVIIENVYVKNRKQAVEKVAFYRFINLVFSWFCLIVFFFIRETSFDQWIFVVLWAFYMIYNAIHLWNNFIELKRTKIDDFKPFKVRSHKL